MRFEEPSSMVRWDSPLYSIAWDDDILNERSKDDAEEKATSEIRRNSTLDDLWVVLTTGAKKGPTAAVAQVSLVMVGYISTCHVNTDKDDRR